jgi:hypothetical protein
VSLDKESAVDRSSLFSCIDCMFLLGTPVNDHSQKSLLAY